MVFQRVYQQALARLVVKTLVHGILHLLVCALGNMFCHEQMGLSALYEMFLSQFLDSLITNWLVSLYLIEKHGLCETKVLISEQLQAVVFVYHRAVHVHYHVRVVRSVVVRHWQEPFFLPYKQVVYAIALRVNHFQVYHRAHQERISVQLRSLCAKDILCVVAFEETSGILESQLVLVFRNYDALVCQEILMGYAVVQPLKYAAGVVLPHLCRYERVLRIDFEAVVAYAAHQGGCGLDVGDGVDVAKCLTVLEAFPYNLCYVIEFVHFLGFAGKPEKVHKLNHIAQIVWKCFQDGETFGDIYTIPYIKATTALMGRIRNYRFKIYPQDSLIPAEVWKYDTRSILEGLHNCIAHQNFLANERIVVTEDKDKLTFENAGGFLEGDYTQYILGTKTPKLYRNPFLMRAMVNLKMIDSQGYGIHNLFVRQKERFLPMPDYNGTDDSHVVMHMYGTVIDENYSLQLFANQNLSLTEAVLLDEVQRDKPIGDEAIKELRKKHLIEGRKPHLFVAKHIAQRTDKKVEYSMHKGLDYKSCESLLVDSLKDHGRLKRGEIDKLLWNVISDQLNETQKKTRIGNILRKLHSEGIIWNETKGNISYWSLVK